MREKSKEIFTYIKTTFPKLNLIGFKEEEKFYEEHFLDIISFFEQDSLELKPILVDMGCGGGFPLIPLKLLYPEKILLGIDSKKKKIEAVKKIKENFHIDVHPYSFRFEEILFDQPCSLFFKVVGEIKKILPLLNIQTPCDLYFFKGLKEESKFFIYDYKFLDQTRRVHLIKDYKSITLRTSFENKKLVKISTLF